MRLTNFTNYALRILQFAALRHPESVRMEDVARGHGISRNHLLKAANLLAQNGLLTAMRGRKGGVLLAREPSSITVAEVVRLTEGPLELVECFNADTNTCPLIGVCKLSATLQTATRAFMAELEAVTIADIAHNRGALLARLGDGSTR